MGQARKIVSRGIFFIFLGIIGVWTTQRFLRLTDLNLFLKASPEKKFMRAWDDDLLHLKKANILPKGFSNLKDVQFVSASVKLKSAFKSYPLELKRQSNGKFSLEIFADEIEGGGIVIQYDLVDIASGNTIWELGRTFPNSLSK